MSNVANTGSNAHTDEERKAVEAQLERLLSNLHFRQSRRFPSFLRFVIGQTLQGRHDLLKERTLGIEIFGREADYDTASDPIVRVTATEIRKRIAQYYQEPGHEGELRVSLPAGSYVPQFHWPPAPKPEVVVEPAVPGVAPPSPPAMEAVAVAVPANGDVRLWLQRPFLAICLAAVLCFLLAGAAYLWRSAHRPSAGIFWAPIVDSTEPILVCLPDQQEYSMIALRDAADPSRVTLLKETLTAMIIDDLDPMIRITGFLQANGRKFGVKGEGNTDLEDLRRGSTIFIGAFDNVWTLRLTAPLRYHFANNPEMTSFRIVDAANPSQPGWSLDRKQQIATNYFRDYALVARFTDRTTGKVTVIAAGIGRGGTRAAGEYISDPVHLEELERLAARAGSKKNLEIVLSTQIIGGEPGSPQVEASYFW